MTGLRWSHIFFLLSVWAVVSFLALTVVGLAWTTRLKPQALADARAQRQEIVRVLAHLADAQVKDRLEALGPVAAHLGRDWVSRRRDAVQRELDTMRAALQMPSLFLVAPDGRPLAFSPALAPDGSSNLDLRYHDRPIFQEVVRSQRPALSGIIFGRATRDFVVGAAMPIRIDEKAVAYLLGSIRLRASIEAIEQAAGPGGWLVMIDADKQAIFVDRKTRQVTQQDWTRHPIVEELASPDADGIVGIEGEDWLVTQAVMPTLRVNLVLAGSVHQILEGQRSVLLTLVATLLVSLATSLAVSTVMALRFVREQQAAVVEIQSRLATRG